MFRLRAAPLNMTGGALGERSGVVAAWNGLRESRITIGFSGGHVISIDDSSNSLKSLGISIELASELIDRVETFFGRAGEPIAKVLSHLVVLVHMIQLGNFAIHMPIIPPPLAGC